MSSFIQPQEDHLLSPAAFILDLEPPFLPQLQLNYQEQDVNHPEILKKDSQDEVARTNSRDEKKRLAGVRSRERKKKYVEDLQQSVKLLSTEVEKYQSQISKCKDQLVEAIRTANNQSNEHAFTYNQLEKQANLEDPDLDTINHLLDLIQSRIGANAKERQTKLDYYFKQITNSLFPAMHRYLMYCAEKKEDIFSQNVCPQNLEVAQKWTKELYLKLKLQPKQIEVHLKFKQQFKNMRRQSIECIRKLRLIRDQMKHQQQDFQRGISEFRLDLDPVQSALIAVFGEKNKLRREFCLGQEFDQLPLKKIKLNEF